MPCAGSSKSAVSAPSRGAKSGTVGAWVTAALAGTSGTGVTPRGVSFTPLGAPEVVSKSSPWMRMLCRMSAFTLSSMLRRSASAAASEGSSRRSAPATASSVHALRAACCKTYASEWIPSTPRQSCARCTVCVSGMLVELYLVELYTFTCHWHRDGTQDATLVSSRGTHAAHWSTRW